MSKKIITINTEDELRNNLLDRLKNSSIKNCEIGKEIPVPYKNVFLPSKPLTLNIWCFKQDIVVYKELFEGNHEHCIIKKHPGNGSDSEIIVKINRAGAKKENPVAIPLVIIETKKGQPNTHEIMTYNQKAQMIKSIFPFCKFIFLLFDKNISQKVFHHGIYFDHILCLDDINSSSIAEVVSIIQNNLRTIEQLVNTKSH